MTEELQYDNPYDGIYLKMRPIIDRNTTKDEAEDLVRHLGLLYNTLGHMMKDLIKVVGSKYQQSQEIPIQTQPKYKMQNKQEPQQSNSVILLPVRQIKKNEMLPQQSLPSCNYRRKSEPTKKLNPAGSKTIKYKIDSQLQFDIDQPLNRNGRDNSLNSLTSKSQKSNNCQNQSQIINSSHFYTQLIKQQSPQKDYQENTYNQHQINEKPTFISQRQSMKPISQQCIVIQQSQNDNINQSQSVSVRSRNSKNQHKKDDYSKIFAEQAENYRKNQQNSMRLLPGRKKKEREQFPGITCRDCDKYYRLMGVQGDDLCNCTSRHRSNLPMKIIKKNHFTQQFDID